MNTNLAAVAGSATAMLWYYMFGKPDITMACNGMLAGLVAITAPCAFVSPNSSVVIGILAGIVVCLGVLFNERVIKVDDPCGAISVHGYCGWLGAVCVGIFADGTYGAGWNGVGVTTYLGKAGTGVTGLLYGDYRQFFTQLGGATFMAIYIFGFTYLVFSLVNSASSMRVSKRGGTRGPGRAGIRYGGVSRGPGRDDGSRSASGKGLKIATHRNRRGLGRAFTRGPAPRFSSVP